MFGTVWKAFLRWQIGHILLFILMLPEYVERFRILFALSTHAPWIHDMICGFARYEKLHRALKKSHESEPGGTVGSARHLMAFFPG